MLGWAAAGFALAFDVRQLVDAENPTVSAPDAQIPAPDLSQLTIPKSLGKVEERFAAPGSRWVVQIQDVHAHLAAQENIAALVEHLSSHYGINTVALEGAWSATSFPKSWGLPPSHEKQSLARALLEEDYLTGPLYAALFSKMPISLVGVEEETLYETSRQIFLSNLSIRPEIEKNLAAYGKALGVEKLRIFNADLLSFDNALSSFRNDEKGEKFIPALFQRAQSVNVSLVDLTELAKLQEASALEESISQPRLEAEAKRLMEVFKEKRAGFEELLLGGYVPPEKLGFYPAAEKYLKLLKLRGELNHTAFLVQIEEAVARVKEKLLITPEERSLDEKSTRYFLAQKLLLLKATPEDWEKIRSEHEIYQKELAAAGLTEALAIAEKFYEEAAKRDEFYFKKITADPRLEGNVAIVTRGFHTPSLSHRLKEAHCSYLVISPSLGEKPEPPNEKTYFERLAEEFPGRAAFSELRNRANDLFDQAFAQAVRKAVTKDMPDLRVAAQWVINYGPRTQKKPAVLDPLRRKGDFMSLPETDQLAFLQSLRRSGEPGAASSAKKIRILVVVRASTLQRLFEKDPLAVVVWRSEVAARKDNTIVIVQDTGEFSMETIGGRAVVRRVTSKDLNEVLAKEKLRAGKEKIGVIDDGVSPTEGVIVLPPHLASFFLLRPLLELGENWLPYQDPQVLATIQTLLSQLFLQTEVKESA